MTEQTTTQNWLNKEAETLSNKLPSEERLPALKLQENKITEIEIDFSKPFEKWHDETNSMMKALVPVKHEGIKKIFWLNLRNPLYKSIISAGVSGKTKLKILQTGTLKNTRYTLIE